jgi:hypothetical protein
MKRSLHSPYRGSTLQIDFFLTQRFLLQIDFFLTQRAGTEFRGAWWAERLADDLRPPFPASAGAGAPPAGAYGGV